MWISAKRNREIVVLTEFLYGKTHMSLNIHMFLHIPKDGCAPPWAIMGAIVLSVRVQHGASFEAHILVKWCALPDLVSDPLLQQLFRAEEYGFR